MLLAALQQQLPSKAVGLWQSYCLQRGRVAEAVHAHALLQSDQPPKGAWAFLQTRLLVTSLVLCSSKARMLTCWTGRG